MDEIDGLQFKEIRPGDIPISEAMHLPRRERRRLAKINGIGRIPGANVSIINPERQVKKLEKQAKDEAKE